MNLLLISNSTNPGEDYLGWPRAFITEFIQTHGIRSVVFIPFAGVNLTSESVAKSFDVYAHRVSGFFAGLDVSLRSVHDQDPPQRLFSEADAIVVGGGNTFHLVKMMHEQGMMNLVREKVLSGIPFIGWSAGSNVACPTMKTTNDMPISEPPSFGCLDLVPFQINPHYLDANPAGHGGETREQRINEFLAVNRSVKVVGLRESSLLRIEGEHMQLQGSRPMRLFSFGQDPQEFTPGSSLDFLLKR
jgi:dipeptidase E